MGAATGDTRGARDMLSECEVRNSQAAADQDAAMLDNTRPDTTVNLAGVEPEKPGHDRVRHLWFGRRI